MHNDFCLRARIRGLYAITPDCAEDAALHRQCAAALRGGAKVLQYRDKNATAKTRTRRALALRELCAMHHALFIVNDDIALAAAVRADGVHLGAADGDISCARQMYGTQMLIGATCQNDIARAAIMQQAGADYCAFGAVFSSSTKPAAPCCDLTVIGRARQKIELPIVAIGGITAQNAGAVFAAGADAVAVCAGLFAAPDIEYAARQITAAQPA